MNTTTEAPKRSLPYNTFAQVAKLADATERRVRYAANQYAIAPTAKVGSVYLFDADTTERIIAAVRRISSSR
jgi:hypothetical protein